MSDGKLGEAGKELATPTTELGSQPSCVLCGHNNVKPSGYCDEVVSKCEHLTARCGCKCELGVSKRTQLIREQQRSGSGEVTAVMVSGNTDNLNWHSEQFTGNEPPDRLQEPPERIWIQGDGDPVDPYQNVALEVQEPYRPDQWVEYRRVLPDSQPLQDKTTPRPWEVVPERLLLAEPMRDRVVIRSCATPRRVVVAEDNPVRFEQALADYDLIVDAVNAYRATCLSPDSQLPTQLSEEATLSAESVLACDADRLIGGHREVIRDRIAAELQRNQNQPCKCGINHFEVMRRALTDIFDYCGNDIQAIKNIAYRAIPNTECQTAGATSDTVTGLLPKETLLLLQRQIEEVRACPSSMCDHCIEILCDDIIPIVDSLVSRTASPVSQPTADTVEAAITEIETVMPYRSFGLEFFVNPDGKRTVVINGYAPTDHWSGATLSEAMAAVRQWHKEQQT